MPCSLGVVLGISRGRAFSGPCGYTPETFQTAVSPVALPWTERINYSYTSGGLRFIVFLFGRDL